MPPRKTPRALSHDPVPTGRQCDAPGCGDEGLYKAPKTREMNDDYFWFCLEHVRAYNHSWDYFKGMDRDRIEHFMRDSLTGHRPTWRIGEQAAAFTVERLQDSLRRFMHTAKREAPRPPSLTPEENDALALLELTPPVTEEALKKRYKKLVKRHHPDVNKGSKDAEETFKKITRAYQVLLARLAPKPTHETR